MVRSLFFAALLGSLACYQPVSGEEYAPSTNTACLRCHDMATLATRNADGSVHSVSVDSTLFTASNHGRLSCVRCHASTDVLVYPHGADATPAMTCLTCHGGEEPVMREMRFDQIQAEFDSSIHASCECPDASNGFTCFTCHDPHVFRISGDPSLATIASQNALCFQCHGNPDVFSRIAGKSAAELNEVHQWLPARQNHWQHVRCLDCHTSYTPPNRSHLVMAKERAVSNCEACHTANTLLATKLYLSNDETGNQAGFLNAAVFNDSYVIGATRNMWLDLFGVLIVGGSIFGVAGHYIGRKLFRKHRE